MITTHSTFISAFDSPKFKAISSTPSEEVCLNKRFANIFSDNQMLLKSATCNLGSIYKNINTRPYNRPIPVDGCLLPPYSNLHTRRLIKQQATPPQKTNLKRKFNGISSDAQTPLNMNVKPLKSLTCNLLSTYKKINIAYCKKIITFLETKKLTENSSEINLTNNLQAQLILNSNISFFHSCQSIATDKTATALLPIAHPEKIYSEPLTNLHLEALQTFNFVSPENLGSGTTGYVWKATNTKNNKSYALKISSSISKNISNLQESNILKHIMTKSNKNKFTCIIKQGKPFLLKDRIVIPMELCETDLFKASSNNYKFSLSQISVVAKQMLSALTTLKQVNIIHGDIKQENILIKDQFTLQIKLADFGIAQVTPITTPDLIQTIAYRSPEAILRKAPYTCSTDMWSLGCVLAEMKKTSRLFSVVFDFRASEIQLLTEQQVLLGPYPEELLPEHIKYDPAINPRVSIANHINETPLYPHETETKKNQLIDLIEKMLKFKPEERISPEEALIHLFFK